MKRGFISTMLLCCLLLTACGGQKTGDGQQGSVTGQSRQQNEEEVVVYQDIQSETASIFETASSGMAGMQYYQGEPVLLARTKTAADPGWQLYLYRENGERELLLENTPYGRWFLDQEGCFYRFGSEGIDGKTTLTKLDSSGKEIYVRTLGDVRDICQLADGRIFLLTHTSKYVLEELDPDTGSVAEITGLRLSGMVEGIGSGEQGLFYLDSNGFWAVDLKDNSVSPAFLFNSTSYSCSSRENELGKVWAFRMGEDGTVDMLRANRSAGLAREWFRETLRMVQVDRITLVLRGMDFNDGWLKNQVSLFNQTSDTYHVVLEEPGQGTSAEDFARLTSVQIAAGGGPDIIVGDVVEDYLYGMIKNGALVDMRPYMESSGIREEDYYPVAFNAYRRGDGIFGVTVYMNFINGFRIKEDVLGMRQEPDVETLVDALLAYQEPGSFQNMSSQGLLEYFLAGSENLWGMVNWESGTCDFGGELFTKILEVSKRYEMNDVTRNNVIAEYRYCYEIISFDGTADQETAGMVTCGYLFDDGCHAITSGGHWKTMAINANSAHVEGAWEFLAYLLGEEAQSAPLPTDMNVMLPVKKSAVKARIDEILADRDAGRYRSGGQFYIIDGESVLVLMTTETLTDEEVEEFYQCLEGTRSFPLRPAPILDIIYEEAEEYFNGIKGVEQVVDAINNRVNLYMSENSI